jgi:hypothetical protein
MYFTSDAIKIVVGSKNTLSISKPILSRLCAAVNNIDCSVMRQNANKSLCIVFSIINYIGDNETFGISCKLETHVLLLAAVGSL